MAVCLSKMKISNGVKKFLAISILSIILLGPATFVLAANSCAEYCEDPENRTPPADKTCICPATSYREISEVINSVINYAFLAAMVVAPLIILLGAFTFMTAAGDPEKVATGKKIIFWAIVGLAIVLFSKVIISIVKSILSG